MNPDTLFINSTRVFKERDDLLQDAVWVNRSLPEQVFNDRFRQFLFEEFDWCMSSEFWPCLQELARASCDTIVMLAVLVPDPDNYFLKEFGYFNWADLPISMSASDYWGMLNAHPKDCPADSVLANSEKVVWLPHSGEWAIWGERSRGICVLGKRNQCLIEGISHGLWRNSDEALNGLLANGFDGRVVPSRFAEKFRFNFQRENRCCGPN